MPMRCGGAYAGFAFLTWLFIVGGYVVVIVGGIGVLGKLWYMRDDIGTQTAKAGGTTSWRRGMVYCRGWGCTTQPSQSPYFTAGGPGEKFGYTLQANCLPGETNCDNPNSALTDQLGNGHAMSDLHSSLEYFIAFPIANLVIYAIGGGILLIYSYQKVQEWLKATDAPDDYTTAARMELIGRIRGICLGFSLIILLNITVETVLRFYYIQVRKYWLPAGAPALYNNPLQIGVEWTVTVLSILWFTLVMLVLTETRSYGKGVTTMGSWYRNVCFLCIPCGTG